MTATEKDAARQYAAGLRALADMIETSPDMGRKLDEIAAMFIDDTLPAPPATSPIRVDALRDQVHRYFTAVHGRDYVYGAPETFHNLVERWMAYTASGQVRLAEDCIAAIERRQAAR